MNKKNKQYSSATAWIRTNSTAFAGVPAAEVYRKYLPSYLRERCTERSFCITWWQQRGEARKASSPVLSNTFHTSVSSTRQEVLNLISDLEKAVDLCHQLGLKFTA